MLVLVVVVLSSVPKMEHAKCQAHNYYNNNNFAIFFLQNNSTTSREAIEKITCIGCSAVKLYLPVSGWLLKNLSKIHTTFLTSSQHDRICICAPRDNMYPQEADSFHLVVCLTTGPKPPPKRALHIVRSRASSFK